MMQYHYFNCDINSDLIDLLLPILNDKDHKEHTFFLRTHGGFNHDTKMMSAILNEYHSKKDQKVRVIFHSLILSNGLMLMFMLDRDIVYYIENEMMLMAHQGGMNVHMSSTGNPSDDQSVAQLELMVCEQEYWMNKFKEMGFTKKELASLAKDEDVFMVSKRAKRFLRKHKFKRYEH